MSATRRFEKIHVIDTHTGGEPTRIVLSGGPDLGAGPMAARREKFRDEFDEFRSAVVNEPRGSDVMVGAMLCEPVDSAAAAGVVFFNNVGVIGMCGHGTIGVAVALAHAGRIEPGQHKLETAVGDVTLQLHEDCERVTVENVASYRHASGVSVDVPGYGAVTGDVAWGGNWFFLVQDHDQELVPSRVPELTRFTLAIREALIRADAPKATEIDHIELIAPAENADARSFVLCPGAAWDRSPCGTGTSAKLACLAADGRLAPGEVWRQESIIGSVFDATYRIDDDGAVIPSITGSAWVTAESILLLDSTDPFRMGIRI